MKALTRFMIVFASFAILTGAADIVLGPHLLAGNGAGLGAAVEDPWLDSQIRFFGAMWAGWGVLMIWACRDLAHRGAAFDLLQLVMFVAGCGRLASYLIHPGSPGLLMGFASFELVSSVGGVVLRRVLTSSSLLQGTDERGHS